MEKKETRVNPLFQFKSLRTTILIPFVVLIAAAVLSFMLVTVKQNKDTVESISTGYTLQLIQMANGDIDSYFANMENIAQLIMGNSAVNDFLFAEELSKEARESYGRKVVEQLQTLKDTRDDIYNIGIIGENGRYLINDGTKVLNPYAEYRDADWYKEAIKGGGFITSSHVQNVVENEYKWVVTLSRSIRNPDTGNIEGVLFIDLNYHSISSLCEKINLGGRGYVFIIDDTGTVIYHPKQQLLYSGILGEEMEGILEKKQGNFVSSNKERMYTVYQSDKTGWIVVGVAYMAELMEKSNKSQMLYIILAVVLISLAALISVLVSDAVVRPIRGLRSSMKKVEYGDLETQLENPGFENELGDLIGSFNLMIVRIKELIQKNTAEQTAKRKSELRALQAQINPHFLYNTLDSIIWMAESKKIPEVILMTSSLSKLLRRSISNSEEIVTVEWEIDYAREYLKIQQMRYHDKLEYEIKVVPEIMKRPMPKLIIQPLVENAIYHGIKLKEGKGTVQIIGIIKDDRIVLQIKDDGMGMDSDTLQNILEKKDEKHSNNLGVQNVHGRMQLYYGMEYGLHYESTLGVGTTVKIYLPWEMDS